MSIQQMLLGAVSAAGGGGGTGGEKSVLFAGDEWLKADDSDLNIGTGDFTVEFWARWDSNAGQNILDCAFESRSGGGSTSDGFMVARWTYSGHQNKVSVYMAGWLVEESGTTALNTWNHWAVVRNSSTIHLYKDGTSVDSVSNSTSFSNTTWYIGSLQNEATGVSGGDNAMRGYITNFRFTKTAVYTSNFTAPTSPLSALSDTKLFCCAQDSTTDPVTETIGDVSLTTPSGNSPSVDGTSPF